MRNLFRQVDAKFMFSCGFSLQFLTLQLFCSNNAFCFCLLVTLFLFQRVGSYGGNKQNGTTVFLEKVSIKDEDTLSF